MKIHRIRYSTQKPCIVCGAQALQPCTMSTNVVPTKDVDDVDPRDADRQANIAWVEFCILKDVRTLESMDPNHWLVRALDEASSQRTTPNPDQLPLFLRRQAE